jgi:hypothetical protein
MSLQGIMQELPYRPPLLTQGLHDGQGALDESTASLAGATERFFSPQNTLTYCTLCSVVGRFHTFVSNEGPQCWLQQQ